MALKEQVMLIPMETNTSTGNNYFETPAVMPSSGEDNLFRARSWESVIERIKRNQLISNGDRQ